MNACTSCTTTSTSRQSSTQLVPYSNAMGMMRTGSRGSWTPVLGVEPTQATGGRSDTEHINGTPKPASTRSGTATCIQSSVDGFPETQLNTRTARIYMLTWGTL